MSTGLSRRVPALAVTLALGLGLAACKSPEERAADHFATGTELLEAGEIQKAAVEFRNVLQIDEDHIGALYGISRYREDARQWDALASTLQRIIDLDPQHVDAREDMCRLMLLSGALDRALEVCNQAERLEPDRPSLLAVKSAIHQRLGDTGAARELAQKALGLDDDNVDARVVLATQQLALGRPGQALAQVEKGLRGNPDNVALLLFKVQVLDTMKRRNDAIDVMRHLIATYPDNRAYRTALARYHIAGGETDAAETVLRNTAAADPDNVQAALDVVAFVGQVQGADAGEAELRSLATSRPDVPEFGLALANVLAQRGKPEEAKTELRRLIDDEIEDGILPAKVTLARILVGEGQADAARALVDEVLEADSRYVDALVLRAGFSLDEGQTDDAVADLRSALSEQPDAVNVLIPLAAIHEREGALELAEDRFAAAADAGRFAPAAARPYVDFLLRHNGAERAEGILARIVERSPNHVPSLALMAQLRLNRQDWQGAQQMADRIRTVEREDATAKQIIGAVLAGQEKYEESINVLKEAAEAAPDRSQPLVALVRTYVRAGRPQEAVAFLNSLLAADPERVEALVLLAAVHEQSGRVDEARAMFQRAMAATETAVPHRAKAAFDFRHEGREAARRTVAVGLDRFPADGGLLMLSATLNEQAGDIDAAIADYERLLESQPGQVVATNNLASLLADYRGDEESLARAEVLAERLRSFDIPQFKDTLAWVHYRKGQYTPAIALLLEAIAAPAPLPIYHYHLAKAYLADDDPTRAREHFAAALELGKTQPFAQMAEAEAALAGLEANAPAN